MFLRPLPKRLSDQLERQFQRGNAALVEHRWRDSFEVFEASYALMLERQPQRGRFHKGLPLHNMGLTRWFLADPVASFRYTLFAFVEDTLSLAEEKPDEREELGRAAASNLDALFSLPPGVLGGISDGLRARVRHGQNFRDPEAAVRALDMAWLYEAAEFQEQPPRERSIAEALGSPWHARVFIGAGYDGHIADVNEIISAVRARAYDAIVATEFAIPAELIHHHCLMLLHTCAYAVFELSSSAGQLMELERCRDYGIEPLVVYQATPQHGRVSAMVGTLLGRLALKPVKYQNMAELRTAIDRYLPSPPAGPP
jgi:hypothetical protein